MTVSYGPHPLKPLNTNTRHGFDEQYNSEQFLETLAQNFIFYFDDKRHRRNGNPTPENEILEDEDSYFQPITDWKIMKDRQKTVSAALLLCLNLGVDPPDVIKTNPCARIEAGVDALTFQDSKKAIEQIGKNLQSQYETLSLRTRFKQSLDPCVEDVKRFCNSLRRTSKDDRILFHYNGHGVPKPTPSGEIWVFNRGYTQYIPVSLYDLQTWLGAPCIFVYDCNSAGNIVTNFQNFVQKRIKDDESGKHDVAAPSPTSAYKECFQLASCRADELLLMAPELPADLFTCCLTNPIDISVKVFLMQSHLKNSKYKVFFESSNEFSSDEKEFPELKTPNIKVPGMLSDRRTPLGELNWIFTAITDTIAWTSLPRPLFKKLFRHDLMVAALFRNFLLAKRIMPWYNCHPVSDPSLPESIAEHPMWKSWDLALDEVLSKLVDSLENNPQARTTDATTLFRQQDTAQNQQPKQQQQQLKQQQEVKPGSIQNHSRFAVGNLSTMSLATHPALNNQKRSSTVNFQNGVQPVQKQFTGFFEQNLTAFELWLKYASNTRNPPEQLPIVLQVLLSQVHRIRALVLLSRFLDLGPWAVYLSLSIGIFPYVLKLLQSPAPELKPILVFIWARIMAIDYKSIQADLLKERGYVYFVSILVPDWNSPQLPTSSSSLNNGSPLTMTAKPSVSILRNQSSQQLGNNSIDTITNHYSNETTDDQKAMAVFILSAFIRDFPHGQKQCFNMDLVKRLCYYIDNSGVPLLRQWSIILLGQFFEKHPLHRYICMELGVLDSILKSLNDPVPEIRAASLLSLSSYISDPDESEILLRLQQELEQQYQQLHTQLQQIQNATHQQYQQIEQQQMKIERQLQHCQEIQSKLQNVDFEKLKEQSISNLISILPLINDGSPLVRKEIIIYFSKVVNRYINFFIVVAFDLLNEEITQLEGIGKNKDLNEKSTFSQGSIFSSIWKGLLILASDPFPENSVLAGKIIDYILIEISFHKDLGPPFLKMEEYLIKRSSNLNQNGSKGFDASQVQVIGRNNNQASNNNSEEILSDESSHHDELQGQFFLTKFFSTLGFKDHDDKGYSSSTTHTQTPKSDSSGNRSSNGSGLKSNGGGVKKETEQIILPLQSSLLTYCYEYFQEPQMRKQETDEPGSVNYNIRIWRRNRNEKIIEETQAEKTLSLYGDWSNRLITFDNKSQPKIMEFTQFDDYLVVADERDYITVYDWEKDSVISRFSNGNPFGTKVTSLKFINEDDSSLLMTGSSDGIVNIYKGFDDIESNQVVTAWRGLTDMLLTPRSSGLLIDWQQIRGSLLATGDVKVIRIWDAHSETVEIDIPAKTSSLVTSITSDQLAGDIFVCGFADGTLRAYDRRLDPRDAMVRLWRTSSNRNSRSAITNVHLQRGGYRELASGTANGMVELWDIRSQDSVSSFNVGGSNMEQSGTQKMTTMTCMQLHEHVPVIATGTKQINLWTTSGDLLSSFNNVHHNGGVAGTLAVSGIRSTLTSNLSSSTSFLSSLALHPHRMMLSASNSHDTKISIYTCHKKKFE
ncbi:hypothetical protein Kpol_513p12 [Vanderwaltozyma polyspora DSM 70294]|uniref:Raptor N-terminal CASPase-like domain-containing protein n=1 Tax=Vanderwaltozyma polyspora (strain ATCC 22028 / DSM 70294 / BCRC 21397 / CBS 2163 / NBRC 10782 / NRRL Y-8283 / UCD 57-17) TaxID=436907 RepID=A7TMJ8_VANPO|nr:uncharacterized protein Kpol_513p12 [Vanderwaltozyma polyspora DSM 70294]EDO16496.1 hypothetical protein Kpol_513p12 [Vanderwaltozyma polyspora DSM 70294]